MLTAQSLQEGDASDWWVGGDGKLIHWRNGSTTYAPAGLKSTAKLTSFGALAKDSDGSLWAGIEFKGKGLGLQHLLGSRSIPFIAPGMDSSQLEVNGLLFDREHSLWIGTEGHGIYRISGTSVEHFGAADGLSSDQVNDLFEDREGNIWAITSKGIDKFRDMKVISYSKVEGLASDDFNSVLAAKDGSIWVGAIALSSIHDSTISTIDGPNGLPGNQVTSLLEDCNGKLWVGVDDKLFVRDGSRFDEITTAGEGRSIRISAQEHVTQRVAGHDSIRSRWPTTYST